MMIVFNKASGTIIAWLPEGFMAYFSQGTEALVWLVVTMNLIRGLPVIWDGREYLFSTEYPKKLNYGQDA